MKITNILIGVGAAAVLAGYATAQEPSYANLIAHRGESVDAPENTLPAYKMAVSRGFGFECDIYRSKDGRLFTFHDTNLKRTTGGVHAEKCTEATWAETVSKVNVGGWGKWKGSAYDPTRPALLEEVLALARPGRKIYVEVKGGREAVKWVSDIRAVFAKEPKATPDTVLFICFDSATCTELKRQMPQFKTHWLTAEKYTAEALIALLRKFGVDGVDICFRPEIHTAEFVRAVHDAGFEFHVWTVDRSDLVRKAFAAGVDSLTTNCAKKMLAECAK